MPETRQYVRMAISKASIGRQVILETDTGVFNAMLLDMNHAGGYGVFIPFNSDFLDLKIDVLARAIRVRKDTEAMAVPMKPLALHVYMLESTPGLRMSAISTFGSPSTPVELARRQANRKKAYVDVLLESTSTRFVARLLDLNAQDGAGLSNLPKGLTLKQLFRENWTATLDGYSCIPKLLRLSLTQRPRLGAILPGAFMAATTND